MAEKSEKQLVVGILAHVDSGKTTLSEAMLYRAGSIRKLGRVDNKDAFLDTDTLEKARGITIFSKQALLKTGSTKITLLDTPGHVDFSTETERTLQVLDYAVLVISGTDGVQSHTETLWRLLRRYHIPTFVFINKMDLPSPGKEALLSQLSHRLGDGFVDFGAEQAERDEALALCDERLMEKMLDAGSLTAEDIIPAVARRHVFPCWFGVALQRENAGGLQGVDELLAERYGLDVEFDSGGILYKETITEAIEGVGHYEPLRHYAEVHLKLEPLPRGSGMQFAADCREEELDKNWQRLVLTHLEEKQHLGVLIGAPLTDMKITLIAGRAHLKHTEGGDFRQATYRAVRQGLMMANQIKKTQLLEPWYSFRLEVPAENIGRAMSDVQRMEGSFDPPETAPDGQTAALTGFAPVAAMRSYPMEVVSYSRGRGHLNLTLDGYRPCHNAAEVIEAVDYEPEHDLDNPADSVFCSHGAGFVVPWEQVRSHMHVDSGWGHTAPAAEETAARPRRMAAYRATLEEDAELLKIFERTYGPIKRDPLAAFRPVQKRERPDFAAEQWEIAPEYLLVDGYNIIFAWDELNALSKESLDAARHRLMDILCNYQGFKKCVLILVFDAYRVPGSPGSIEQYHNIHVVYTKEAETADMFIERVTHEIGKNRRVRVATSDGMEQVIILGHGALRVSARMFHEEVQDVEKEIRRCIQGEA